VGAHGAAFNFVERGQLMGEQCTHLDQIREVTPSANGCEECLQSGDRWVHLRMCLVWGMSGVAIRRRTSTQRNTFTPRHIR
jgi:hypothetical protein